MPDTDNSTMRNGSSVQTGKDRENSAHCCHISVATVQKKWNTHFDFTVAAPSFVIPAGAAENSRFLADFFPEIGLLFFETEACLNYTASDLPPDLAELPVSWHVHLPLDLPWEHGLDAVWTHIDALMRKAAFLSPRCWVLHPPTEPDMLIPLAARFRAAHVDPADILLENVDETDLCALWQEARTGGYSTCLDLGHIIAYGQHSVLDLPGLWDTVRMLHLCAPGENGRHLSLANLNENGQELLHTLLERFNGDAVTLEVFEEKGLFESVDLLAHWVSNWSAKK